MVAAWRRVLSPCGELSIFPRPIEESISGGENLTGMDLGHALLKLAHLKIGNQQASVLSSAAAATYQGQGGLPWPQVGIFGKALPCSGRAPRAAMPRAMKNTILCNMVLLS